MSRAFSPRDASTDAEVRRRLEELIALHGPDNPHYVRLVRAVQVLEYAPGPEARALLEDLAGGPKEHAPTREARQALGRLRRYWRW